MFRLDEAEGGSVRYSNWGTCRCDFITLMHLAMPVSLARQYPHNLLHLKQLILGQCNLPNDSMIKLSCQSVVPVKNPNILSRLRDQSCLATLGWVHSLLMIESELVMFDHSFVERLNLIIVVGLIYNELNFFVDLHIESRLLCDLSWALQRDLGLWLK